jgi:hypothetical protein
MTDTPTALTEAVYNIIQLLEALSNDNIFFTGINFRPSPTIQDALEYYIVFNDGEIARNFRERINRKRLEKKP